MANWGLSQNPTNALFMQGVQMGQNFVDRREARAQNNALLGMKQQELDQRTAERTAQQQRQQQEQRRADLPTLTRLVEYAQDETTYQQARATAQEYGIDVSTLPPNFDPAWREQQLTTLRALQSPQAQEALSTAGRLAVDMGLRPGTPAFNEKVTQIFQAEQSRVVATQPGGGAASVNPVTGEARFLITPNDGSQPPGAPAGSVPPPPAGFVIDEGGPASAPGGFPFR